MKKSIFVALLVVVFLFPAVSYTWENGFCLLMAQVGVRAMKVGYEGGSYTTCYNLLSDMMNKNQKDPIFPKGYEYFLPHLLDYVVTCCVKGVELARAKKPFYEDEFLRILYYNCLGQE